jgi:hypothetical protein
MRDNIMAMLPDNLDELDRLVRIASTTGMPSEDFLSGLRGVVDKVRPVRMLNQNFWDASEKLAESIVDYENHPTPESISNIRNKLVGYRTTATS